MSNEKDLDKPVTLRDFQEYTDTASSIFATKEDLKGFATKEDLKGFATKEDLKGFATKEDLRNLNDKIENNAVQRTDQILISNDKLSKKLDTLLTEKTVLGGRVDENKQEIDGLKGRVTTLEQKTSIQPA